MRHETIELVVTLVIFALAAFGVVVMVFNRGSGTEPDPDEDDGDDDDDWGPSPPAHTKYAKPELVSA